MRNVKRATVGSSREIWCSNRETGRFHEKLGDSRENRESWQVCYLQLQEPMSWASVKYSLHKHTYLYTQVSLNNIPVSLLTISSQYNKNKNVIKMVTQYN